MKCFEVEIFFLYFLHLMRHSIIVTRTSWFDERRCALSERVYLNLVEDLNATDFYWSTKYLYTYIYTAVQRKKSVHLC